MLVHYLSVVGLKTTLTLAGSYGEKGERGEKERRKRKGCQEHSIEQLLRKRGRKRSATQLEDRMEFTVRQSEQQCCCVSGVRTH